MRFALILCALMICLASCSDDDQPSKIGKVTIHTDNLQFANDKQAYLYENKFFKLAAEYVHNNTKFLRDVYALSFSSNGHYLASCSWDNTIRIVDIKNDFRQVYCHSYEEKMETVAFSSDSRYLASGGHDNTVTIIDVKNNFQKVHSYEHEDVVWSLAFSPNCRFLTSGSADGAVFTVDIKDGFKKNCQYSHESGVRCIAFSPCGKYLASGCMYGEIVISNVANGLKKKYAYSYDCGVNSIYFCSQTQYLACCFSDSEVKCIDLNDGFSIYTSFNPNMFGFHAISISSDGKYLAMVSRLDKHAMIFDVQQNFKRIYSAEEAKRGFGSIAFSPDGHYLATGSTHGVVKIFDILPGFNTDIFTIKDQLIDWSKGDSKESAKASATCNAKLDGNKLTMKIAINNSSKGTLYQVSGKVESSVLEINNYPVYFGKINPGSAMTRVIQFELDKELTEDQTREILVTFTESNNYPPEDITVTMQSK